MIIRQGTTHPGHRRIVLMIIAIFALVAALAVTMQTKEIKGAIVGLETATRVSQMERYQSGCNECLDKYTACTALIRRRRDYNEERIANINRQCATQYKNCRNRVQCFN